MRAATKPVKIGIVGKYFGTGNYTLADSYISVIEAIKHAGFAEGVKPELTWIDSEKFEGDSDAVHELKNFDAIKNDAIKNNNIQKEIDRKSTRLNSSH